MSAEAATRPQVSDGPKEQPFDSADGWLTRTDRLSHVIYWGIHASCLFVFVVGAPSEALWLALGTYAIRVFGITGGYHRYFSHRAFKTSRVFQFALAFLGCSATQKGPLWWCGTHRRHHRFADAPGDPHSPRDGFWYAHQGWIFDPRTGGTPIDQIRDFSRYPELVWLNQYHFVAPLALAVFCYSVAGWAGVVWGFAVSTTVLWHATYSVNSFAHRFGFRRYDTGDTSRNNPIVAFLTFGEGWHNNHHHFPSACRSGFKWWEVDVTYYTLRVLSAVGLVWDLKQPPASLVNPMADPEVTRRAA